MNHPHMIYDLEESDNLTSLKEKTTAIIPTSQADIRVLMWSVFSLLLHSKQDSILEHICVAINGPDSRTGDPSPQDEKQRFIEDLRECKWHEGVMPITLNRVWSRLGHTECIDAMIPWVHTDTYLLMHDDVLVTSGMWSEEVKSKLYSNKKTAIAYLPPLHHGKINSTKYKDSLKLGMTHLNTSFMCCKKGIIHNLGANWKGYHIEKPFNLPKDFMDYYPEDFFNKEMKEGDYFGTISAEVGAWVFYTLYKNGYKFEQLNNVATHLGSASWGLAGHSSLKERTDKAFMIREDVKQLIIEIEDSDYGNLYRKYA